MKLTQKQIFIIAGVVFCIIVLSVVIGLSSHRNHTATEQVTLAFWGVDPRSAVDKVLQSYRVLRPNVTVNYAEVDPVKYNNILIDALASGNGPDVLSINNRDLPKQVNKLSPILPTQMGLAKFRELFPGVAEENFVSASGSQIFALPLYVDSLAMIYNKNIFDQAAITSPPKTWDDFLKIVPNVRVINASGQITRAAAAIGGTEASVDSGVDLLNLLMLQNGTKMTTTNFSAATFADFGEKSTNPGIAAFNFYLQFANNSSPYYTWNDGEPNSVDSFASGNVAVIFNYKFAADEIKSKSPFLKFGVSEMPQPAGSDIHVNYARYSGLAVSKQSKQVGWAWDFILFMTTNADASSLYLAATGHPPALRSLIAAKLDDPDLGVFAKSALTARSWYEADAQSIGRIFNEAIGSVLSGRADSAKALRRAEDQVSQLMTNR